MRVFSARSSALSTLSRWSTSPASTRTSHEPHSPSSQSLCTSTFAARSVASSVRFAGTVSVSPESFSSTSNG